jgi:hypothetical protein
MTFQLSEACFVIAASYSLFRALFPVGPETNEGNVKWLEGSINTQLRLGLI